MPPATFLHDRDLRLPQVRSHIQHNGHSTRKDDKPHNNRMAAVAALPPDHAQLLQQFEDEATAASAQVALRYSDLKKHFSRSRLSLFNLLTPNTRRTVAIATAAFGNASPALERLHLKPWNVTTETLLDTFGDSALLSERFIRGLDQLASTANPPSWPDAAKAIITARDQRRSGRTGQKGVSATREVIPKDVQEAAALLNVTIRTKRSEAQSTQTREPSASRSPLHKSSASQASADHPSPAPPRTKEPSASPEIPRPAPAASSIPGESPVAVSPYNLLSDTTASVSGSQLDEDPLDPLNFDDDNDHDDEDGFDNNTFSDLKLAPQSPRLEPRVLPQISSFRDDSLTQLFQPLQHGAPYSPRPQLPPSSSPNLRIPLAPAGREAAPAFPLAPVNMEALVSQEALERLQDGCRLNDEAIHAVLERITPSTFRIIELSLPPSGRWDDWARAERHYNLDFGTTNVLVPLYTPRLEHWALLRFNLENSRVTLFDSYRAGMRPNEVEAMTIAIAKAIGRDWAAENWRFKIIDMPQQRDDIECGIFLLVASLHIVADMPLPEQLNPRLWRQVFRSAASGNPGDAARCLIGVHLQQSFDGVTETLKQLSNWKADVGNARAAIAITNIRLNADSTWIAERISAYSRAKEMAGNLLYVIKPYLGLHSEDYLKLSTFLEEDVAFSTKQRDKLQGRKGFVSVLWQAANHQHARLNELIEQVDTALSSFKELGTN